MSHYTVLVVTTDPKEVDDALAPFDEGIQADPVDQDEIDLGKLAEDAEEMATVTKKSEDAADYLARAVDIRSGRPERYLDSYYGEGRWRQREDGLYVEVSTYNPLSKWDWWTIGGRWAGKLILRPDVDTYDYNVVMGDDWRWHTDQARLGAIDLDAMRQVRRARALTQLAEYAKVIEEHGPVPSRDWIHLPSEGAEFKEGKQAFWNHPAVKALDVGRGAFDFDDLDHLDQSTDGWVKAEEVQAVTGWAVLTHEGQWMEQGSMGWFGMSDTTMHSRIGYLEAAGAYVESLGDDMWLTNIDVHI